MATTLEISEPILVSPSPSSWELPRLAPHPGQGHSLNFRGAAPRVSKRGEATLASGFSPGKTNIPCTHFPCMTSPGEQLALLAQVIRADLGALKVGLAAQVQRETEKQTDRDKDGERERGRERQRQRERWTEKERGRQRQRGRDRRRGEGEERLADSPHSRCTI